jgi:hypothetical protein
VRNRERGEGSGEDAVDEAAKMGLMESISMAISVVELGGLWWEGGRCLGRAMDDAKWGELRREVSSSRRR